MSYKQNDEKKEINKRRFENARSVNLGNLLESMGCEFKHVGGKLRSATCPHCGGSTENPPFSVDPGENYYFCHKCGKKGNPIDLMVNLHGCNPFDAVERLIGERDVETEEERNERVRKVVVDKENRRKAKELLFKSRREFLTALLSKCHNIQLTVASKSGIEYLNGVRGLSHDVIKEAFEKNKIAFMPDDIGERYTLIKSCLNDKLKKDGDITSKLIGAIAHRPLMFPFAGEDGRVYSMEFRAIEKPEFGPKSIRICPAEIPWIWRQDGKGVIINEGVIDGLSAINLGFKGTVISIPGINQWKKEWNAMLKGERVIIIFDNDPKPFKNENGEFILDENGKLIYPGIKGARNLRDQLLESGMPMSVDARMPSQSGSDINDVLLSKLHDG